MPIEDSSSSRENDRTSGFEEYGCADRGRGIGLYSGEEADKTIRLDPVSQKYDDLPGGGVADCTAPEINCSDRSFEALIF